MSAINYTNMRPAVKHASSTSNRLSGEWLDWCQTKERIGQKLREFYRANMTDELPPRLLALIKKLESSAD
jgi:hypothetical protein